MKSNTNSFIVKSKVIHGDTYDYRLVDYVNAKTKVLIICKKHGEFYQAPTTHLQGRGCRDCGFDRMREKSFLSNDQFLEKALSRHGKRYIYNETYTHWEKKILVTCRIHGQFSVTPANHIKGRGCPHCANVRRNRFKTYTVDQFKLKATKVHGKKYDYSSVKYSHGKDYITIICPEHGKFTQRACEHLNGNGCNKCPYNYDKPTAIYLLKGPNCIKVGISVRPHKRHSLLNRRQPFKSELLKCYWVDDFPTARKIESKVHFNLSGRSSGFHGFDGCTEWFNVDQYEVDRIINDAIKEVGPPSGVLSWILKSKSFIRRP